MTNQMHTYIIVFSFNTYPDVLYRKLLIHMYTYIQALAWVISLILGMEVNQLYKVVALILIICRVTYLVPLCNVHIARV